MNHDIHRPESRPGPDPVTAVSAVPSELGESPLWRPEQRTLAYVDMVAGNVVELDLESNLSATFPVDRYLGAVVAASDGRLACVTLDSVTLMDATGELQPVARILSDDRVRLNDAACDPAGRLWMGSTSLTDERGVGGLHVLESGRGTSSVKHGLTQPNGLGWSPQGNTMYIVDSGDATVYAAAFDVATGSVGELHPLLQLSHGVPDGLTVAKDGTIWVAVWDGASVVQVTPSGKVSRTIDLPVQRPTSCALTADGELLVTTARFGLDAGAIAEQPLAGHVLRTVVNAAPGTVTEFRI